MTGPDYEPEYDDPRPDNPIAKPTTYTVTCLPDTIPDASSWDITIELRGDDSWAVKHWSDCLGRDGAWDHEPRPLANHRFPFSEALDLAKAAAPHVIVNGFTPADLLEWHAAGCPRPIPRPARLYITEAGTK